MFSFLFFKYIFLQNPESSSAFTNWTMQKMEKNRFENAMAWLGLNGLLVALICLCLSGIWEFCCAQGLEQTLRLAAQATIQGSCNNIFMYNTQFSILLFPILAWPTKFLPRFGGCRACNWRRGLSASVIRTLYRSVLWIFLIHF